MAGVGALSLGNWLLIFWVGTWLSKLVGASLFRFGRRLCMLGSEKMKRHLRKEYRALGLILTRSGMNVAGKYRYLDVYYLLVADVKKDVTVLCSEVLHL